MKVRGGSQQQDGVYRMVEQRQNSLRRRWSEDALERTLHAQVAREIGLRILEGDLAAGTVLPNEVTLGLEFGVSRTVLREAIKVLSAKRLVEVRRKTGTRIRPRQDWNALDPDILKWLFSGAGFEHGIADLLELRLIVEPAGARLAALRRTPEDLAEIGEALQGMETAVEDAESSVECDLRFHMAVLDATHNAFMRPFGALIQEALRASFKLTNRDRPAYERSLKRHRDVFESIAAQDAGRAEAAMQTVLNRTSEDIERSIADRSASTELELKASSKRPKNIARPKKRATIRKTRAASK
jgi:DNA-binding FadR family transcriptional regulator